MALGCAGATLVAAGCGLTNASSKTETVTVTRTVTHTVTAAAPATTTTTTPPGEAAACTADQLSGIFAQEFGSAGAGNIVYKLRLTNTSQTACFVSGLPVVQLLDAHGKPLPTHATAQQPGTQTAVKATLAPGASASAEARFSPDVTGVGETGNPCEPVASTLQVTVSGTLDIKIDPPTSVCSHGALQLTNFAPGS